MQMGAAQIGTLHLGEAEIGIGEVGTGEIGAAQLGVDELGVQQAHRLVAQIGAEIGAGEIGAAQIAVAEAGDDTRAGKIGVREIGRVGGDDFEAREHHRPLQAGTGEVGAGEIGPHDPGEIEPRLREICPGEVRAREIGIEQDRRQRGWRRAGRGR